MRVTRERATENRAKVVAAAARLFREHGFDGVGVDAIMKEAGLTHGGFYANFASKGDLVAEAVAKGLADSRAKQRSQHSLQDFAARYLSPAHRTAVGEGCVLAALGPDAARHSDAVRAEATAHVKFEIDRLAGLLPPGAPAARKRATTALASTIGALILARLVDDPRLSDEILAAAKTALAEGTRAD